MQYTAAECVSSGPTNYSSYIILLSKKCVSGLDVAVQYSIQTRSYKYFYAWQQNVSRILAIV